MSEQNQKLPGFAVSLLSAIFGLGLLCLSIYLGAKDDFLATLFLKGGSFKDYAYAGLILAGFVVGIVLIGKHLAKEGVAENFYEHPPY